MREQNPIIIIPSVNESKRQLRRSSAVLKIILLVFVLGLGWASFSDLDQVVTTEAKIIPFEKLQTVQHFEGGIVEHIFVRAGDVVRTGDQLMTLNAVEASGGYQSKKTEVLALAAKVKRLEAQANVTPPQFGPQLEREIPAVLVTERELLKSFQDQQESAVGALRSQQQQRRSELEAARQQLILISEEKRTIEQLVARGLEPRLEAIRAEKVLLEAEHRVRSAQDSISELDSRIAALKQDSRTASLSELTRAMTDLKQSEKALPVVAGKVDRTVIRSPSDGVVNRVLISTIGAVLRSGEPVVEIVPKSNKLTFEARVLPADIGFVKVGQIAQIKMTAYDFSMYGSLKGVVNLVAADTVSDERGQTFYNVRIDLTDNRFNTTNLDLKLIPGMTAQIDIVTGKRSVLSYLSAPITKTLTSAFKEK